MTTSTTTSPLLGRPGAVAAEGADAGVAAHYGDPMREQRLLAEGLACVDLSHRGVVTVAGPDRLTWLHSMTTQELTGLAPRQSRESLVLSPKGHVEHALHLVDDGERTWLSVEPGTAPALLAWLQDAPFGIEIDVSQVLDQVRGALSSGGSGGAVVDNILTGLSTAGQFLAGLALTVVLLFFIVKDGDVIVAWLGGLLSRTHRPTAAALGQRAWSALSGYVRGTAAIAAIDAIGIGIGLAILGVPLVFPLMLLVFFGGFLPVVGAFLAGLVAVLVALASGGFVTALLALGVVLLVQQLEGNFLHPTIMHRAVALHPIVVLLALGAGAALAGIIGAFLSVPIMAVVAAVGNELRLRNRAGLLTAATAGSAPSAPLGGGSGSLDREVDDAVTAAADPAAREDRALDLQPGED